VVASPTFPACNPALLQTSAGSTPRCDSINGGILDRIRMSLWTTMATTAAPFTVGLLTSVYWKDILAFIKTGPSALLHSRERRERDFHRAVQCISGRNFGFFRFVLAQFGDAAIRACVLVVAWLAINSATASIGYHIPGDVILYIVVFTPVVQSGSCIWRAVVLGRQCGAQPSGTRLE
jgi:hypothetical protein